MARRHAKHEARLKGRYHRVEHRHRTAKGRDNREARRRRLPDDADQGIHELFPVIGPEAGHHEVHVVDRESRGAPPRPDLVTDTVQEVPRRRRVLRHPPDLVRGGPDKRSERRCAPGPGRPDDQQGAVGGRIPGRDSVALLRRTVRKPEWSTHLVLAGQIGDADGCRQRLAPRSPQCLPRPTGDNTPHVTGRREGNLKGGGRLSAD